MAEISLTQGKVAIVDGSDLDWLYRWKWQAQKTKNGYWMVIRSCRCPFDKKRRAVLMSRQITGATYNKTVDHKNQNTFDNRRENLRICSRFDNAHNRKSQVHTSKYKGVGWHKSSKGWRARIRCDGIRHYLGHFSNEIDAAISYDVAAKKYHREFACLNFP
jgi:hypothetical protein